jgi:hypothetical protein
MGKPDRRMELCPPGYEADTRLIEQGAVSGRVNLMGNNRLCEESIKFLEGLGVETFSNGA